MTAGTATTEPQSHIIERPRLLKKLDEATGRLILLVAPAGYGKTTLARAWARYRPHSWYRPTSSARDVASLVQGIGAACDVLIPGSAQRVLRRLAASSTPQEDVADLAEVLAEDLAKWPSQTWLVVDDYHNFADAPAAQEFFRTIFNRSTINLLIASRIRPSWITSRSLVYGDAVEVGQQLLSMEETEVRQVLRDIPSKAVTALLDRASGWPAVVGLAARVPEASLLNTPHLPEALYDYVAEELYATVPANLRPGLQQMALLNGLPARTVAMTLGPDYEHVAAAAVAVGFVAIIESRIEMHPLLQSFLEDQLRQSERMAQIAESAARAMLDVGRLDEAFELGLRFDSTAILTVAVEQGWETLLEEGKVSTLARWVSISRTRNVPEPTIGMAAAEVAIRQGRLDAAEKIALSLVDATGDSAVVANAYTTAGTAAHIASQARAFGYFERAISLSPPEAVMRRAQIGRFLSALEFQPELADELFEAVESSIGSDQVAQLRTHAYRIMKDRRVGDVRSSLRDVEAQFSMLDEVDDPMARTAFIHAVAIVNFELARYQRARALGQQLLTEGLRYRLNFVLPYAHFVLAGCALGLKQHQRAIAECEQSIDHAIELGIVYPELNSTLLLARIYFAKGDSQRSQELLRLDDRLFPVPALAAEYHATRAFIQAASGRFTAASETLSNPASYFRDGLVASIRDATEAITCASSEPERSQASIGRIFARGQLDVFVHAYRAAPTLLRLANEMPRWRGSLRRLIASVRDTDVAAAAGIQLDLDRAADISPREAEVLRLVSEGLRNKEIAERLYISEVTVKAHLRHAFEKLQVSSRTQAVLAFNEWDAQTPMA